MDITEIRLRRSLKDNKVLANASVVFDGAFVVHDVRLIDGSRGPFVSMPSRRTAAGDYLDVAHPLTAAYREELQARVLAAYQEWSEKRQEVAADRAAALAQPTTTAPPAAEEVPAVSAGSAGVPAGGDTAVAGSAESIGGLREADEMVAASAVAAAGD